MQSVAAELQHETVAAERFRRASPHIVAAGRCRRALMQSVAAVLFIENVGDVSRVSQQLFVKSAAAPARCLASPGVYPASCLATRRSWLSALP